MGCLIALTKAGNVKDPEAVRSHLHVKATVTDYLPASLGVYREPAGLANDQVGWLHLQAAYITVSLSEDTDFPAESLQ